MVVTSLSLALIACAIWIIYMISKVGRRESFLPPGPPTLPILGNMLLFPTHHPWYKLTEMAREYGEIYSLKICSRTIVVLSSATVVSEFMEKNSSIVSDRPHSHIGHEVTGGKHMALTHYGDEWRLMRRCVREIITVQACRGHLTIQQAEATQLMHDFLIKPEEFFDSVRRFSASVILSVIYGKRAPQPTSSDVVDFFEVEHRWEHLLEPGAHAPVDLIPILKNLQHKLYFGLLEQVEERMKEGMLNGCWMGTVIEQASVFGLNRETMGQLGGMLIEGGSDTTTAFIQTLILALVNFPEVQRLAQEEIDCVVGNERAPMLDDIERLPYIQAVIKETHRWRPVAPLAVPHASIEDVSYKGYVVPKGSILFINNWGIFYNKDLFEEPSIFNPERWLKEDMASDRTYDLAFGCARWRACPDVNLARNSVNITAMNFLWGFNFSKVKDPLTNQEKVYDLHDFARGILTGPNRFDCDITPRSAHHVEIIRQDFSYASSVFETFEHGLSPEDRAFVSQTRDELKSC